MSILDKAEEGQQTVNRITSFIDWLRSLVTWIRRLFGNN